MFICTELIEETRRLPGLILACGDIFGLARTSSSFGIFFTHLAELWRSYYCHIFESVKNHINADISHSIRDRNAKT